MLPPIQAEWRRSGMATTCTRIVTGASALFSHSGSECQSARSRGGSVDVKSHVSRSGSRAEPIGNRVSSISVHELCGLKLVGPRAYS